MQLARHLALIFTLIALTANQAVEASQSASTVQIDNEHLTVVFDTQAMTFTVASKTSGVPFVEKGTLRRQAGAVRRHDAHHTIWGRGQAIEVEYSDGGIDRLTLFETSPLLVFNATLSNPGSNDLTINRIHPLRLTLALRRTPADLRALGTAGLTGLDRKANPGSYSFLAVADPDTRAGLVAGWVSHDRGSGVLFTNVAEGKPTVDARLDYGRLLIEPGCKATSETLVLGYFRDARLGLEAYADAVATYYGIVLPPQPTVYCTWYHAGASNQRDILANARFAQKHLAPYGFSVVQIDDRWQAGEKLEGPRKNFTTHRPDGPYPAGMTPTAAELTRLGMIPGIWFMPFAGTWDDPYYADKQHFFARKDGKPYVVRWGGTCFDLTHPDVRQYVFDVLSIRVDHHSIRSSP